MCLSQRGSVRYAPMCIVSFRVIAPKRLLDAQQFNLKYQSYDQVKTAPERLRWCRYHSGLLQQEVAEQIGASRDVYMKLENGEVDYWPPELVDKLAALYQIPEDDLLDAYNRFLRNGQGEAVRRYRERLGMTRKQFAEAIHVEPGMLRRWETVQRVMTKRSWERYFANLEDGRDCEK